MILCRCVFRILMEGFCVRSRRPRQASTHVVFRGGKAPVVGRASRDGIARCESLPRLFGHMIFCRVCELGGVTLPRARPERRSSDFGKSLIRLIVDKTYRLIIGKMGRNESLLP